MSVCLSVCVQCACKHVFTRKAPVKRHPAMRNSNLAQNPAL